MLSIAHLLKCVQESDDPATREELSNVLALHQRIYTAMINVRPPFEWENRWAALIHDLTDIGNQLIKFLGG